MFTHAKLARAALTAAGLALAPAAMAQDGYPRVIGSGENQSVEYGPMGSANILGGGRVTVTGYENTLQQRHEDAQYAQQPPAGRVPVAVGSGENLSTNWVPAMPARLQGQADAPSIWQRG